ncbi:class I SAM-dependent methyltransferase [Desulfobacula phenolica]|uniref:Methyltransferase domain-containing protein n=1 Tax=Desulfobacula phenolica TaxID=90732 RepID=A0A1H2DRH9_9BACT|nr:class I SAM-dependent methyltransferase [Desulfobacula phenolica]SDT85507.1 Methyltransferase domain-containing protein [Desulfobacula phenolica]
MNYLSEKAKINIEWNKRVWGDRDKWLDREYGYNWSRESERPQNYSDAKKIVETHLFPLIKKEEMDILELCPGAGRVTVELVSRARNLILVDMNPVCIEICKDRFKYYDHISYHVNDGVSLDMIEPESLDLIFSYDSFVHIDKEIVEQYVSQFRNKLRDGGIAWIHHSAVGERKIGSRSNMTAQLMKDFAQKHGLLVIAQFYSYLIRKPTMHYADVFTVLEKLSEETAKFSSLSADQLE